MAGRKGRGGRGLILVTGASGFIGGALSLALAQGGLPVRAVYRRQRPPAQLKKARKLGAEIVRLDLTAPGAAAQALQGVEKVVHAAALASDWGPLRMFLRLNFELTRGLAEEAERQGVKAFVYISSVVVHGFGRHVDTTEEGPYYPLIHPYQISKKQAESYVLSRNSLSFRTVAVRPGNVYGPGDTTTFYPILEAMEKGVMGFLGGGRSLTCPVYIDDLLQAVILCLDKDWIGGEAFDITGGEKVSWRELLEHAASLLKLPPPKLSLPIPLAYTLAFLAAGLYQLLRLRSSPPLTRYRVAQLARDYHFSIEKAQRMLGYAPQVGWREGFSRMVAAYRKRKGR